MTDDRRDAPEEETGEIRRVRIFMEAIEERAASRVEPFRWGRGFFDDDHPNFWDRNFLRVETDEESLDHRALIEEAERLHGEAGHRHRSLEFRSETVARRLAPGFASAGWMTEHDLVMVHGGTAEREIDTSTVSEASFEEIAEGMAEFFRRSSYTDSEETVHQLVDANRVTSRVENTRHFAIFVDGKVASSCDLYSDGHIGQVEDVNTLEEFRNRGFARATVSRAVQEAHAAGCDLVFLLADRDDWPRHLYTRLGFEDRVVWTSFKRLPTGSR